MIPIHAYKILMDYLYIMSYAFDKISWLPVVLYYHVEHVKNDMARHVWIENSQICMLLLL